jgi:hypothetical protein
MAALESSLLEHVPKTTSTPFDDVSDQVPPGLRLRAANQIPGTYKHLKELQKLRNEPKEPPGVSIRIIAPPSDSLAETAQSTSARVDNRFSPPPAKPERIEAAASSPAVQRNTVRTA